jgi:hypothetical protein
MKYINDLAYSSHIAQTKQLAKDKKQKNKYRQTALLEDSQIIEDGIEELAETSTVIKKEQDRRAGSDRRKSQENRGRYVESRLTKNRRYKKKLSLVI